MISITVLLSWHQHKKANANNKMYKEINIKISNTKLKYQINTHRDWQPKALGTTKKLKLDFQGILGK